jgi:hypothetical protein
VFDVLIATRPTPRYPFVGCAAARAAAMALAPGEPPRRHPDVFTDEEAAAYLHAPSPRSLETIRRDFGLVGHQLFGKSFLYHREDLDAVVLRMFGKDRAKKEDPKDRGGTGRGDVKGGPSMKIAGGRG